MRLGDGKTQQNISKAKIETFPIVIPSATSTTSQARIVAIMATVDDQIEALERELDLATTARAALVESLLARKVEVILSAPLDDLTRAVASEA